MIFWRVVLFVFLFVVVCFPSGCHTHPCNGHFWKVHKKEDVCGRDLTVHKAVSSFVPSSASIAMTLSWFYALRGICHVEEQYHFRDISSTGYFLK